MVGTFLGAILCSYALILFLNVLVKLVLNKEIAIVLKSGNIREQDILKNGIHSVDDSKQCFLPGFLRVGTISNANLRSSVNFNQYG